METELWQRDSIKNQGVYVVLCTVKVDRECMWSSELWEGWVSPPCHCGSHEPNARGPSRGPGSPMAGPEGPQRQVERRAMRGMEGM